MVVGPFVRWIAKAVSVIGHPLVVLPLIFTSLAFRYLPLEKAAIMSAALVGGVILPIAWRSYRNVQRGHYTNFDVSNQTQRTGFYPVLLLLTGFFTLFLFATNQYEPFNRGAICFFLMLAGSYAANFFLKISLHTSINFFLAVALYTLDVPLGFLMGVFSVLVALSRLVLERHSAAEISVGVIFGLLAGAGL
ncbi:hypothetical protein [Fibrella aquatica]|uniref:hypothetical protein n=1 Tax=Fibrella aquatica TaxID=3242487 RepID=UPI00352103CC